MKYLKMFEMYDLRNSVERFSSALIDFTNQFFNPSSKDKKWIYNNAIYPAASWVLPNKCEINFYMEGIEMFSCILMIENEFIFLLWTTDKFGKHHSLFKKYVQFGKFIIDNVRELSEKHDNVRKDNRWNPLSEDDIYELIKILNMNDFELYTDMKNYNL